MADSNSFTHFVVVFKITISFTIYVKVSSIRSLVTLHFGTRSPLLHSSYATLANNRQRIIMLKLRTPTRQRIIRNWGLTADRYLWDPHTSGIHKKKRLLVRLDERTMDSICRADRPLETRNLCRIPPNSIHTTARQPRFASWIPNEYVLINNARLLSPTLGPFRIHYAYRFYIKLCSISFRSVVDLVGGRGELPLRFLWVKVAPLSQKVFFHK